MSQYAQAPDAVFDTLNFTGGAPGPRDLSPSIVFIVCYALTLPLLFFRLFKKQHRCLPLVRPTLFVFARLGMLALRIYMAKQYPFYTLNELIAELVLVSLGYIFLADTLVALWKRNVESSTPISLTPKWVQLLAKILHLMLLASIITIIIASTSSSNSFSSNGSGAQTALSLRHASYILSFAVTIVVMIAVVTTHFEFKLDPRRSFYIFIPAISLCIVGIYRIVQTFSNNPSDPIRQPVAFWIMQGAFEYIAYISFLVISIPEAYPKAPEPSDVSKEGNNYYSNGRGGLLQKLSSYSRA